jgi:hypothetical protein
MRSFSGNIHHLNKVQQQSFMMFQRQLYTCRFFTSNIAFLTHVQSIYWYKIDAISNLHFYLFFCFLFVAQITLPLLRGIFRQTSIVAGYPKDSSGSGLLGTGPFETHLEVMESSWVVLLLFIFYVCMKTLSIEYKATGYIYLCTKRIFDFISLFNVIHNKATHGSTSHIQYSCYFLESQIQRICN